MSDAFDLVVRGGQVFVDGGLRRCDVGISQGRIAGLERDLPPGRQEIHASGRLVLPGGVDAHCHIEQRSSTGLMTADDFLSGSLSAACGGTTTIVPFAAQHRGQSLEQVLADAHRRAEARAAIDYSFHLMVSDAGERTLGDELPRLIDRGYTSFKIYMTYEALRLTDRQALEVLALAGRLGGLTLVHAENHDMIGWLTERLLRAGHTAPRHHCDARPAVVEREAVERMIALSEVAQAPVLFVHVSCGPALEAIRRARARGLSVYAETCPQYLMLSAQDLDRPGFEGAKFMCSPPPRSPEDQRALWEGLVDGAFDVFSSDHAPYRFDDAGGKKVNGEDAPFPKVPNGVPSIELRLPILFSEGVRKGRLGLARFVALTAENPARLFGLYPTKGTIALGSDADLAIWDPEAERIVTQGALHDRMDYTPFEGLSLSGWPITTLSRGEPIVREGRVQATPGRGRFVPRTRRALGAA